MEGESRPWSPARVVALVLAVMELVLGGGLVLSLLIERTDAAGQGMAQAFAMIFSGLLLLFTVPALILAIRGSFQILALVLAMIPVLAIMLLTGAFT